MPWIIPYVVMAIVAAAAYFLLKPKIPTNPLDDSRTEPSVRGTLSSFLLGRLRIGPVIGYVGGRVITKEKQQGGGGKGGGGGGGSTTIFNEVGMHIIAIGRGRKLRGIYQGGKRIMETPIARSTTVSGTTVDLGIEGSFKIYWGEDSQPVDVALQALTGLASTFPHVFYIVWNKKRLGTSAVWPQLEYDVEVEHPADMSVPSNGEYLAGFSGGFSFSGTVMNPTTLSTAGYNTLFGTTLTTAFVLRASPASLAALVPGDKITIASLSYTGEVVNLFYSISANNYLIYLNTALPITSYGSSYTSVYQGAEYSGVNPASALHQILFSSYPHGLGWNIADFTASDFTSLALFFKSTERSPCTILLRSGKSFKEAIGMLMQDFGLQFYYDTTTAKYRIIKIRAGDTIKNISLDEYRTDDYANTLAYSVLKASRTVYSFQDSARKFAASTILITDDGNARFSGDPSTNKIDLSTITDLITASMVASRREQESSLDGTLAIKVSCTRLDLLPGDLVQIEGMSGYFRLLERRASPDEAHIVMSFALDTYSVANNYVVQVSSGKTPMARIAPSADLAVGLIETNRMMQKDINGCLANRIRYSGYIAGAELRAGASEDSFDYVSNLSYSSGGKLVAQLTETASVLQEYGPVITVLGPDVTDIQNLTGSEDLWRSGYQLAIIGTEICYLRNIDVGTSQLKGLIRARMGSKLQTHPAGTPVFIVRQDALVPFVRSYMIPGGDVFIKSLPYSSQSIIDASEVTAVSLTYKGGGYRPLPCENLNTVEGASAWIAGGNVDLRWSYKHASDAGAAGIGLSDTASVVSAPEGTFRLQFFSGATLKRTVDTSGTTYTYTNANLVSDFGSEPTSFIVKVVEVLNSLTSEEETATITRV